MMRRPDKLLFSGLPDFDELQTRRLAALQQIASKNVRNDIGVLVFALHLVYPEEEEMKEEDV